MDPTVEKYLNDLRIKREEVEKRLRDREHKKKESDEMFVSSVKKELEWLEKNKIKYELRNKKFLEQAKDIVEDYKAELAKAYQADQALNASKRKLNKFIQKNYPKIVSELKARLFRDHDDVSRKLKSIREGGTDMLRLNKEIKDLSEEIQAKRYELLEEEERRLRNEGSLKYYQYVSNPYTKPYDAPANYGKRTVSPPVNHDMSRSKGDISVSPQKGIMKGDVRGPSHHDMSDDIKRPSVVSKASNYGGSQDRDVLHAQKGVSFGRGSEATRQREPEPQTRLSYGDNKSIGNLKLNDQKKSPQRVEDEWEEHDHHHHHRQEEREVPKSGTTPGFGKGVPVAVSGFGGAASGLQIPAKEGSPAKSGFGQGAGMQKLNLSNIGATKQKESPPPKHNYYDPHDVQDIDDDF